MSQQHDQIIAKLDEMRVDIAEIRRDVSYLAERVHVVQDELKPVKRHVTMMEGALALLSVAGVVGGVLKLLRFI